MENVVHLQGLFRVLHLIALNLNPTVLSLALQHQASLYPLDLILGNAQVSCLYDEGSVIVKREIIVYDLRLQGICFEKSVV